MGKEEILNQIEELIENLLDEVQPHQENDVRQLRREFRELQSKLS